MPDNAKLTNHAGRGLILPAGTIYKSKPFKP